MLRKLRKKTLLIIAYCCLAVSIGSLFTSIIGYRSRTGVYNAFSIMDFFKRNGKNFERIVAREYTGTLNFVVSLSMIRIFAAIAVVSLLFALVGLLLISKQRGNAASFVLTMIGFIGTIAPSAFALFFVVFQQDLYHGTISCGIYPIVAPIAMILCIMAATQMHRNNLKYKHKLKQAKGLIQRGGDL